MELDDAIPILFEPVSTPTVSLPKSTFTWRDALLQRNWGVHIYPDSQQMVNIMLIAGKLAQIPKALYPVINVELEITSWLRCPKYNIEIGGARHSAHLDGAAVDFRVKGAKSYVVRERLKSELQRLDIRMEKLSDECEWIHIDLRKPENGIRYFNP